MITLENLLSKGYFPKELPPPFTTKKYAEEYIKNRSKFKGYTSFKKDTECINYSLAKVGLIRKTINIPNPSQQSPLCELIIEKWSEIEAAIQRSSISSTKLRSKGKRAYNIMPFKEFRRKCFLVSYQYKYEVKTDISQFFGSIYTHSIPWALHGKSISKVHANRTNYSLLGVDLDRRIRCTTHGQTNGIPISPDTSLIISEIVASSIDYQIQKAFPGIKGCRYVDDMYFFFDSLGQAEKFLIKLQEVLQSYQLSLNSSKTKISKLPIGLDEEWINELRSFNFRETEIKQYNDIINYFSLAFRLARENPSEFVLSYAVRTTMYLKVLSKDNYQLLEIRVVRLDYQQLN